MRKIAPLFLLLAGCASAPTQSEIRSAASGPAPDVAVGTAMIEDAARQTLKDPDSAKFVWPHGFVSGWYQQPFGKRYMGWITCGTVNAKNSYGGYVGRQAVIGVITDGAVSITDMDSPNIYGSGGLVSEACSKIGVPVG